MKIVKKILLAAFFIMLLFVALGCTDREGGKGHKRIDFTVCDESKMPRELLEIIEEKKEKVFKLTYVNNDYLYIAVGYGEHERANLNVVVKDLYLTSNAIYLDTNLYTNEMTPSDAVAFGGLSMCPYIVLKCERYELPVVFNIN